MQKEIILKIDIDDYLTESEKKECAIDLFKEELRKGFLSGQEDKRINNYERVINNAIYNFLHIEIDKVLGTNFKEKIEKGVKKVLSKDLTYSVFRSESLWGGKLSVAQQTINDTVVANTHLVEERVKKAILEMNFGNLEDYFIDVLKEVIIDKLAK